MRSFLPVLAAAAVAMSALATAVQAAPIGTVQVRVSSVGLDLATDAGAAAFFQRLSRAAKSACGGYPDYSPLVSGAMRRFELCQARALAGAVGQSKSAALRRQFAASRNPEILRLAQR